MVGGTGRRSGSLFCGKIIKSVGLDQDSTRFVKYFLRKTQMKYVAAAHRSNFIPNLETFRKFCALFICFYIVL